jgi:hypothetical protein
MYVYLYWAQVTNLKMLLHVLKRENLMEKRPWRRPRRRWSDNIKMELQEVGRGVGDWMALAQDRDRCLAHVSTVKNFRVP